VEGDAQPRQLEHRNVVGPVPDGNNLRTSGRTDVREDRGEVTEDRGAIIEARGDVGQGSDAQPRQLEHRDVVRPVPDRDHLSSDLCLSLFVLRFGETRLFSAPKSTDLYHTPTMSTYE